MVGRWNMEMFFLLLRCDFLRHATFQGCSVFHEAGLGVRYGMFVV